MSRNGYTSSFARALVKEVKSAQSVAELDLAFVVARLTFSVPSALNSFGIILCFGAGGEGGWFS